MGVVSIRHRLASLLGQTHSGRRDLYEVFGYEDKLTFEHYYGKYRRQNLARRIVNLPANATWLGGVRPVASNEFLNQWDELNQHNKITNAFKVVDKLAGLGHFAVLILGFQDNTRLEQPATRAEGLAYLQPYSEGSVKIHKFVTDPNSDRFGLPEMYKIEPKHIDNTHLSGQPTQIDAFMVHHTRVIHVAEDALENPLIGTPRLEPVFNDLDDLLKVSGGTAETYWITSNRGMQADLDPESDLTKDEMEKLEDELERYQHQLSRIMKTRGVTLNSLGSDTPSPKEAFNVLISLIAGTTGIPQRILLGSEAGHLASEQDRANWSSRITERREEFAEPSILHPTVERLRSVGLLPDEEPSNYAWQDPFILSPLERGQTMAQVGRAAVNLHKQLEENPILTRDEARTILGFEGEAPEPTEPPDTGTEPEPDPDPDSDPNTQA